MKFNKLLLVSLGLLLGLSACNTSKPKEDTSKSSGSELVSSEESESSEEIPPEPEKRKDYYYDSGMSIGFPERPVTKFLENYLLEYDILPIEDYPEQEWYYDAYTDDDCRPRFFIQTEDANAPYPGNPESNGNAVEDHYKDLLEEAGIVVDAELYKSEGYRVLGEDDSCLFSFFSWESTFKLFVYGEIPTTKDDFRDLVDYLVEDCFFLDEEDLLIPEVDYSWSFGGSFTCSSGANLSATTIDGGTIGADAYEDSYKDALVEAGWDIDDSAHIEEGYYASKDDSYLIINFYTSEGEFKVDIYFNTMFFPSITLRNFLNMVGLENTEFPLPESDSDWYWYTDGNSITPSLIIYTEDLNSPDDSHPEPTGNAIEDSYKSILEENGFEVDDSRYESTGYLVTLSDDYCICFYSYDGDFYICIESLK